MLSSTGVVYLVLFHMINTVFPFITSVEPFTCPSGSTSTTANFRNDCQCADELPLQLQLPKDEVFCVSEHARFKFTAFCNQHDIKIEFVQQRRHDLDLMEADPHTVPIYTSDYTHTSLARNIYIILEYDQHEQPFFAMYMNTTIQTNVLLAYQLIENPNEINTNDWVELCLFEGVREELGAPNCNTQTESGSAPQCICPAEKEMNFSGGCNYCQTGMFKTRAGNNMCQCGEGETCTCSVCGHGYERPNWYNDKRCACKKCPPCGKGHYAVDTESENCNCHVCPQSYDATDLTSKLNHNPSLVAGGCMQFL